MTVHLKIQPARFIQGQTLQRHSYQEHMLAPDPGSTGTSSLQLGTSCISRYLLRSVVSASAAMQQLAHASCSRLEHCFCVSSGHAHFAFSLGPRAQCKTLSYTVYNVGACAVCFNWQPRAPGSGN